MKKYFTKISALLILTAIFFTASSFCFHGLVGSIFNVEVAHAATIKNDINIKIDTCVDVLSFYQRELNRPTTSISNQVSLSPCCDSSSRPNVISSASSMFEINKATPILFLNDYKLVKTILISAVYYKPLSSPPELLALKSTILRI